MRRDKLFGPFRLLMLPLVALITCILCGIWRFGTLPPSFQLWGDVLFMCTVLLFVAACFAQWHASVRTQLGEDLNRRERL